MFNPMGIDPSKIDPKILAQLSELVRQLPPDQLGKMQTLMHNAMAGFDVRRDMEEFERSLPPGFREKIASVMLGGQTVPAQAAPIVASSQSAAASSEGASAQKLDAPLDIEQARITILRAVAQGNLTPEEAERLLFPK